MIGEDARALYERGDELASQSDFEAALEAYRLADEQGHPSAAAKAGLILESRGEIEEAHAAYTRADERGSGLGAFRLGLLLAANDRWDEAMAAWERSNERGSKDPGFDLAQALRAGEEQVLEAPSPVSRRSALASPVLVGAATVLVTLVAVFLAYNANQGLPFVPTRELKVDIGNGSNLVVGNDVREGGFRIGLVSQMKPVQLPSGQVGAQLTLQLNKTNGRVPVDSVAVIRPLSLLGLKYVDLRRGSSRKLIADGGVLPISHTNVPVQFDDVFKTFDSRTRVAIQQDLAGYGDVLTGRGGDLNDTIAALPSLLLHLRNVAGYLSDPGTQLTRFFDALNRFMGAVAPVAQVNVALFRDMATTFGAIARDPRALEQTIAQSPPTELVGTDSLRAQRPFLADFRRLGVALGPGTRALGQALPVINPALEQGARVLGRTPPLDRELQGVMSALKKLALAPGTNLALNALSNTTGVLNPMLRYLGPFQTVCDYWDYWWTNLGEHLSARTNYGFAQRAMINLGAQSGNGIEQQGANAPANGVKGGGLLGGTEYLHAQNYEGAIDNHGYADCEIGQRGYPLRLNHFDPLRRNFGTDPHTPGDQGPTFKGRRRVPAGETYSREPQSGPQLAPNPANP